MKKINAAQGNRAASGSPRPDPPHLSNVVYATDAKPLRASPKHLQLPNAGVHIEEVIAEYQVGVVAFHIHGLGKSGRFHRDLAVLRRDPQVGIAEGEMLGCAEQHRAPANGLPSTTKA